MGVESKINRYLNENIYDYALMIDGKWGIGKSYTIKEYIKKQMEKGTFDKEIIYLSLYKIENLKDLEEKVFEQLFKNDELDGGKIKSNNEVFNGFTTFLSETAKVFVKDKVGINIDVGIEKLKEFHKTCVNFNNYIFCFDDFERTKCDITKILGFINDLIDIHKCKVILIANESEILKRKNEEYELFKEKVIGRTVKFSNDFIEVKKNILDKIVGAENYSFKKIIEKIKLETDSNLRIYQYFISVSYKLYKDIKKSKILDKHSNEIIEQVYYEIFRELYNKILEEREKREHKEILFKSINKYLSEEIIDESKLRLESEIFIENLDINRVDKGLVNKLKNSLYLYENDNEIEEDLKKVLENLNKELYKLTVFPEVLFAILYAESIGFENLNVFEKANDTMITIIKNSKRDYIEHNRIYTGFIYDYIVCIAEHDKNRARFIEKRFGKAEKEIEKAIKEMKTVKEDKIKLINLKDTELSDKLATYLNRKDNGEIIIFDTEEVNENLIEVIKNMDCRQIHKFRQLFLYNNHLKEKQIDECKRIYSLLKNVNVEEFSRVKKYAWSMLLGNINNLII